MNDSSQKRILMIEDNIPFTKILSKFLQTKGYAMLVAENGMQGIQLAKQAMPDLILLDLMLPGLDGHKVCRLIKYDQKIGHIPVVILTSRDLEEDAELAKKHGADAFVVKTTHRQILLDVIQKLLKRSEEKAQEKE